MAEGKSYRNFKVMLLKIHLLSFSWSVIAGLLNGLLSAIVIYLLILHLMAFSIYFLKLEKLTLKDVSEKLKDRRTHKAQLFRSMKKSRSEKSSIR